MVPNVGFELTTYRLQGGCSTTELIGHGSFTWARTTDLVINSHLLCRLSYERMLEVRVRFELTTFRICNPVHLTTLPSHYNLGRSMGIEPILTESQSVVLTVTLTTAYLAEYVGIEPTHPLLNDSLANCCLNRSASIPCLAVLWGNDPHLQQ